MFSAKTINLLMAIEKCKYQGRHVIAFKPDIDDRYASDEIVSHTGWKCPAIRVSAGYDIYEILANSSEAHSVVAVDEMFMIKDCGDVLIDLYKLGMSVFVSTLDMSAKCKPFKEVAKILPWATKVEKCCSVCVVCGGNAQYTYKKYEDDEDLQIGGSELYEPRCFACHPHTKIG